jgi:hypothetical protein
MMRIYAWLIAIVMLSAASVHADECAVQAGTDV